MGILDIPIIEKFIRLCQDGWELGWHERNGGNLTYRLAPAELEAGRAFLGGPGSWVALGVSAKALAGEYFITTGSGKHFRNVKHDPESNIGLVEINQAGDSYRIVWGLKGGAVPTSELPTHFLNHAVRHLASKGLDRVIYHAHPPNLIALTYVLPLTARDFTRALWQSATECCVVFPAGVGLIPWMIPGGAEIAQATSQQMKDHAAVVWPHHGLFCSGPNFDETLGLMHTIEQAAKIFVKVSSTGLTTLSTITDDHLRAMAAAFKITLNESFLN
ncbi:MAG: rhamnulose-1-phosphate aldolase [Deltaproteobacteria bacterium]|jgi:rhamnulose-1-phosphate aldolase|nr:rhamnulose-1-phosphate aldolase [Deltaproteobacteria bacterium]